MQVIKSPIAIEGGEIETNGEGTVILVEAFTKERNAKISSIEFEKEIKKLYGASQIIWLKEGAVEDPATGKENIVDNIYGNGMGGHIDEFARFVNANTLFLAFPTQKEAEDEPMKKIMYDRMDVNFNILNNSYTKDKKPFNIVKIPVPDVPPLEYKIDTLKNDYPMYISALLKSNKNIMLQHSDTIKYIQAVSYLNFLQANNTVLIPKYWKKGFPKSGKRKDRIVKKRFQKYYPGKRIIQIDVWALNFGAGGMHCWTQQVPQ